METLQVLIAISAVMYLEIEQMDFTAVQRQGPPEEDIFLVGIKGLDVPDGKVIGLNRSLEGRKQSGCVWNKYISKAFGDFGLSAIMADSSVFVSDDRILTVVIYVDDLLIFSSERGRIDDFKTYLLAHFKVRDMGLPE